MASPKAKRPAKRPKPAVPAKRAKGSVARQPEAPAKREEPAASAACPRCGTPRFGPEERIRAEGTRTVRYTVLVCERGHTFAKPRAI